MTNMAVEQALSDRGVPLVRAKVGDRYVLEELIARGWQLGGENSGHLLVLDRHTTGDGIVSALQVLQAVRRTWPVAAKRCWTACSSVPAGDDQCSLGGSFGLAAKCHAGGREGAGRSTNSAAMPAGC